MGEGEVFLVVGCGFAASEHGELAGVFAGVGVAHANFHLASREIARELGGDNHLAAFARVDFRDDGGRSVDCYLELIDIVEPISPD